MHRSLCWTRAVIFLATAFMWACRAPLEVPPEIVLEGSLQPVELTGQRVETMEDTLGFHAATDLLPVPGGYMVVDAGNDRLVRLNRGLEPVGVIGRSGSGPGELEAPFVADLTDDGVAVVELSNGRVSFFTFGGAFERVVALPGPWGDLAVGPDGDLFLASAPPHAFLTRIGASGETVPFGRRLRARQEVSGAPGGIDRRDRVAVTDAGFVAVLDNTEGHLLLYDDRGSLERAARLPDSVVQRIRSRNESLRTQLAREGRRVVGMHIAKGLKRQPDGRLLVLFTASPHFGLLVDPATLRGRLLSVPEAPGPWDPLLNAAAAVVEGDEVTVLHAYGVTRYRLGDGS